MSKGKEHMGRPGSIAVNQRLLARGKCEGCLHHLPGFCAQGKIPTVQPGMITREEVICGSFVPKQVLSSHKVN